MYRIFLPLLIILCITITFADSAAQTDWSGGAGIPGPVDSWQDRFATSSGLSNSEAGEISLNTSLIETTEHLMYDFSILYRYATTCDVNNDGHIDVAFSDIASTMIYWAENTDGSGQNWVLHEFPAATNNINHLVPLDMDDDDDLDFLAAIGDGFYYYENLDGLGDNWNEHLIDNGREFAWRIAYSDFDEDGDYDAVGAAKWSEVLVVYENIDGLGHEWATVFETTAFYYPSWIQVADIDGDGDQDIASGCANYNGIELGWIEQEGVNSWIVRDISSDNSRSSLVYDWDDDGDQDILVPTLWGAFSILTMYSNVDGCGDEWEITPLFQTGGQLRLEALLDIEPDGDQDIVGYCDSQGVDHVVLLENLDGRGLEWILHKFWPQSMGLGCWSVADLNEDGFQDLVAVWSSGSFSELYWLECFGPSTDGWLRSSILYLQNDPGWGDLDWSASEPGGSSVSFRVRASDDFEDMGVWSDTLSSPCSLQGYLEDYDSYFQYEVILQRQDTSEAPLLHDVILSWNPLSIQEHQLPGYYLSGPRCNPSSSPVTILFSLSGWAPVDLAVFDLAGRLVYRISDEFPQGECNVVLPDLQPGIYFVTMTSGDFFDTQRFVVIE